MTSFSSPGICRQPLTSFSITSSLIHVVQTLAACIITRPPPYITPVLLHLCCNIPVYPQLSFVSGPLDINTFIYLQVLHLPNWTVCNTCTFKRICSKMCFSVLWMGNIYVETVLITQQKLSIKVYIIQIFIVSSHSCGKIYNEEKDKQTRN